MKLNNPTSFNGKYIVKATGNQIDAYDGSKLTGLKFTQLEDIGTPSGNKVLITNPNGDGLDYVDMNFNAVKEIDITNQDSNIVTWNENICVVEHNMNGYVFIQVYDEDGDEIPLVKTHIDENHISAYFESKPGNGETYKMVCLSGGYSLNDLEINKISLASCSNLGFFIDGTKLAFSWTDPDDVVLNGATLATWEKTVLVRKEGSYPENHTDGTIIASTNRIGQTKNYYRDHSYIETEQGNYFYMLFSNTTAGVWNNLTANKFTNGTGLTWQQVGDFVDAGRGAELFPVGTTFIVDHAEYTTSTGIQGIAFTVLGHDQVPCADETLSHNMCLGMSEIIFNAQYDANELTYVLTNDTVAKANKTYYIYDNSTYIQLVEGTDYNVGDNVPVATYYEKNLINRHSGSNNFAESNLLQWANSNGNASLWFEKQTIFDVCGSVLNNKNGFLKNLDSNFLSVVKNAKLITAKCNEEGGGSYITNAKFWPLSNTQVFGSTNNRISENERLSYFESNSKIKSLNGVDSVWWLRSPSCEYTYFVCCVSSDGASSRGTAGSTLGVSLACIIGKSQYSVSWTQIQEIVRNGGGPVAYPVGTKFIVPHTEYTTSNGIQGIEFVVLGYDQVPATDNSIQHTMCLGMTDLLFECQFDGNELEYALTKDIVTKANKTYYTYDGSEYIELVAGTDYQVGDTIPENSYYEKNSSARATYGNSDFGESNIFQWANSNGSAGEWFVKQNIWDTCGTILNGKNGFLKCLDSNFLSVVKEAELTTNTYKGISFQTMSAKFWLLSLTQVFGTNNGGIQENEQLTYFINTNNRIKKLNGNNSSWMLRSNLPGFNNQSMIVTITGESTYSYSFGLRGISLACIIG